MSLPYRNIRHERIAGIQVKNDKMEVVGRQWSVDCGVFNCTINRRDPILSSFLRAILAGNGALEVYKVHGGPEPITFRYVRLRPFACCIEESLFVPLL